MAEVDLEEVAREMIRIYERAEFEILDRVFQRLKRGLPESEAELRAWEKRRLNEIVQLRVQIQERLGILSRESAAAMQSAIEKAFAIGFENAAADLGELAELVRALTPEQQRALDRSVFRFAQESIQALQTTHEAILRSTLDVYRTVISDTVRVAVAQAVSPRDAARQALRRFAERGITGFVDSAGRRWDLISYAEMSTRTAAGRAAIHGYLDHVGAGGIDLVMVVNIPEECPICRPWEGKVLSRVPSRRYPTVAYAMSEGLFHPNCRHGLTTYIEGVVKRPKRGTTADKSGYEERMRQRQIERNIRRWKRRELAALDDDELRYTRAKQRAWQAEMRSFINKTHRRRMRHRESLSQAR